MSNDKTPAPKKQSDLLRAFLRELGIELPHQSALEAVARVMGHKDWKTYCAVSAASPASKSCPNAAHMGEHACANRHQCWEPCGELGHNMASARVSTANVEAIHEAIHGKDSSQTSTSQDDVGMLFTVSMTVDVSMTRDFTVRASDAKTAEARAQVKAAEEWPTLFSLDEGNYRGVSDFYCGDSESTSQVNSGDSATKAAAHLSKALALTHDELDLGSVKTREDVLTVRTHDGEYEVRASMELAPGEEDVEDSRAAHALYVDLVWLPDEYVVSRYAGIEYVDHGDSPSVRLFELLDRQELTDFVREAAR